MLPLHLPIWRYRTPNMTKNVSPHFIVAMVTGIFLAYDALAVFNSICTLIDVKIVLFIS